jgi:hypothetical protein
LGTPDRQHGYFSRLRTLDGSWRSDWQLGNFALGKYIHRMDHHTNVAGRFTVSGRLLCQRLWVGEAARPDAKLVAARAVMDELLFSVSPPGCRFGYPAGHSSEQLPGSCQCNLAKDPREASSNTLGRHQELLASISPILYVDLSFQSITKPALKSNLNRGIIIRIIISHKDGEV